MVKYTCETCNKEFSQKEHWRVHLSKKVGCVASSNLDKKSIGQYFTISETLQNFVFDTAKNKGSLLLEPSFGAGHLLKRFKEYDDNYPIICYELDHTVLPVVTFNRHQTIVYGDFTKQTITTRFNTIIGNPPYVKRSEGNLYIQFIKLCFNLLDTEGELIFIVPSDFIKLTSASSLIEEMMRAGSFTHFMFPNDETLFDNANIDVMVFRYEKGLHTNTCLVNNVSKVCSVRSGIVTFSDTEITGTAVLEMFNVYVGMVSGRDEIYKSSLGNMELLVDKDKEEKFILVTSFPSESEAINTYLLEHKSQLLDRRIRKFTDTNWFEWGAPRNKKSIELYFGKRCIYIKNMTRNEEVAFIGNVQYFGGTLLCLIPKVETSEDQLEKIAEYLNSSGFRSDYIYSGRFKIGHKQISNAILRNIQ